MFTANDARDLMYHTQEDLTPKEQVIDDLEDAIALAASHGCKSIYFSREEAQSEGYTDEQVTHLFSSTVMCEFNSRGFSLEHPDPDMISIEW